MPSYYAFFEQASLLVLGRTIFTQPELSETAYAVSVLSPTIAFQEKHLYFIENGHFASSTRFQEVLGRIIFTQPGLSETAYAVSRLSPTIAFQEKHLYFTENGHFAS